MKITGQWGDIRAGGFIPDGEPLTLQFRETPKLYFVTFPSGWIKRCHKFNRLGERVTHWRESIRSNLGYPRAVRLTLIDDFPLRSSGDRPCNELSGLARGGH